MTFGVNANHWQRNAQTLPSPWRSMSICNGNCQVRSMTQMSYWKKGWSVEAVWVRLGGSVVETAGWCSHIHSMAQWLNVLFFFLCFKLNGRNCDTHLAALATKWDSKQRGEGLDGGDDPSLAAGARGRFYSCWPDSQRKIRLDQQQWVKFICGLAEV